MKKFIILILMLFVGSFGYTCDEQSQCNSNANRMCGTDRGIRDINIVYSKFLSEESLGQEERSKMIEKELSKPIATTKQSGGAPNT